MWRGGKEEFLCVCELHITHKIKSVLEFFVNRRKRPTTRSCETTEE